MATAPARTPRETNINSGVIEMNDKKVLFIKLFNSVR
jgi:hypothetical protein